MKGDEFIFRSTTSNSSYNKYTGQRCEIVEQVPEEEAESGPMFDVKFADGQCLTVFEDELHPVPALEAMRDAVRSR